MKKLAGWASLPLLALALSACGGSGGGEPQGSQAQPTAENVVDVTDAQGAVEGYEGALEDAEITSCEISGDEWVNTGTITNPTAETQDYRVFVSFMNKGDTRGLVQVDVPDVAAGESSTWSATAQLDDPELECVLRVERFAPQG